MKELPNVPSAVQAAITGSNVDITSQLTDLHAQISALHAKKAEAAKAAVKAFEGKEVVAVLTKGRVRKATVVEVVQGYGTPSLKLEVTSSGGVKYNETVGPSRVRNLFSDEAFADALAYKEAEAQNKGRTLEDFNVRARQAEEYAIQASEQAKRYASQYASPAPVAESAPEASTEASTESDEG